MAHQRVFRRLHFPSVPIRLGLVLALLAVTLGVLPVPVARAATFDVDRTDDNAAAFACTALPNDCSLRGAITAAKTNPGPDIINLPANVYTLTGSGDDTNAQGDLDITGGGDLTINGAGAGSTIINGPGTDRVLQITAGGITVNISGVTIQNGNTAGVAGGICNWSATVNIANSIIYSNTATLSGGAIANLVGGTVTIANSAIYSNTTTGGGGGIYNLGTGTVTIANSAIYSNTTTGGSGGGIYNSGTVTIANSTIFSNTAYYGGGIYVYATTSSTATATLNSSTVSGNTANSEGGGILVRATSDSTARLTLDNSTVSGNEAASYGGGVEVWPDIGSTATATLNNSTVVSNTAGSYDGGGIEVWADSGSTATVTLNNSTVSGNDAGGDGGGIEVYARSTSTSTVTLNNSTVSGNDAGGDGGGFDVYADSTSTSTVNLNNVTITDNTADDDSDGENGGGISIGSSSTVNITNTIVAGNHDGSGTGAEDCSIFGTFNSQGYNLVGDGTGCPSAGTGDQTTADPRLGSLADNGGPSTGSGQATWTHALLVGSPAIDAIPVVSCTVTTDQRGQPRPMDGNLDGTAACDIGAYEFTPYYIYLPLVLRNA